MKIILAILAILCATSGISYHNMIRIHAEVNKPAYFRSKIAVIFILLCADITYFLSIMSFGLEWYWSLLITIPSVFLFPVLIYQTIHEKVISASYTLVAGAPSSKVIVRIALGLILSIIAICI